jgi:hypothetical protein
MVVVGGLVLAGCNSTRRSVGGGDEGEGEASEGEGEGEGSEGEGEGAEGEGEGSEGEGEGTEGEGEGTEGEGEGAEGEGEGAEGEGEGEGAEGEGEGEGSGPCLRGDKKCVGDDLYYCVDSDEWLLLEECATLGQTCEGGKCVGCEPGTKLCRGQSVVECQDDGKTELVAEVCGEGSECKSGACVTSCSMGGGKISYQGCEYWAVDLENADIEPGDGAVSPADAQFGVVISNTDSHNVANVKIYRMVNGIENLVMERDVPPRTEGSSGIEIFELPASNGLVGSSKGTRAFRVVTSAPVIAYQFNPLHNTEQAFSNDASLLLPTDALDREYLVTTGDGIKLGVSMLETVDAGSYVVVVGVTPEPAQVTIEASVDVVNVQARDVTVVGRTVTASVGRYEVLAVSSRVPGAGTAGEGNLSGTRVIADRPVAVFSGNVATVVPAGPDSKCCADHLEEQIFPLSSWGRRFVAPHSLVRRVSGVAETDGWRITAAEAATTLTYTPSRPAGAPQSLGAGESVEFFSSSSFMVLASKPVLVTQFLTSSGQAPTIEPDPFSGYGMCAEGPSGDQQCTASVGSRAVCYGAGMGTCSPISDPSMILIPPVEQFRDDYLFLAPRDYDTDFINVMAKAGTNVTLDDTPIAADRFLAIGELDGTQWRLLTLEVSDGAHRLTANQPVGLLVYGYDKDVSYGYPGGLNLERINLGDEE